MKRFSLIRAVAPIMVLASCEPAADELLATAPSGLTFQQSASKVVIEAENYTAAASAGPYSWGRINDANASGGAAMKATPDSGGANDTGYTTRSPRLSFDVNFTETGTHYVWIRGRAPTSNPSAGDSVHVGLDGAALASSDRIQSFATTYGWVNTTRDGVVATISVPSAGVHRVDVWMREDGFIFDKLIVSTDSTAPQGLGPEQSPTQGGGTPTEPVLAFPGARGFAAQATGGRGGKVIRVTNLNASGPGSLNAALADPSPRIIVFTVSGIINSDIQIPQGNVTIAGQTAPGAGITIVGRLLGAYSTSVGNIIIRHVRVRPPAKPANIDGNQYDAVQFSRNHTVMLDHMSVSYGVDENVDFYEAKGVTVQWSTIESAATIGHPEGEHNYGLIGGPSSERITLHHNLFASNKNRNAALGTGPTETLNNVVYNVRHGFVHHNAARGVFRIQGNYYRKGPSAVLSPFFFDAAGHDSTLRYYLRDNYINDPGDHVGVVNNPWTEPVHNSFTQLCTYHSYGLSCGNLHLSSEPSFAGMTGYFPPEVESSTAAYDRVIAQAGAFPRDVVTQQSLQNLMNGTGTWGANRPANLLTGLTPGSPPTDSDGDGMPDAWESARGLNPSNGSDHTTVRASGYTAIEEYINGRAAELIGQ